MNGATITTPAGSSGFAAVSWSSVWSDTIAPNELPIRKKGSGAFLPVSPLPIGKASGSWTAAAARLRAKATKPRQSSITVLHFPK